MVQHCYKNIVNNGLFSTLIGQTLAEVELGIDKDYITFKTGTTCFTLWHSQDCCEQVTIEDICGDLTDLLGTPILQAEMVSSTEADTRHCESQTWTFYKLATMKGAVTIRWLGESNGDYSEEVDLSIYPRVEEEA